MLWKQSIQFISSLSLPRPTPEKFDCQFSSQQHENNDKWTQGDGDCHTCGEGYTFFTVPLYLGVGTESWDWGGGQDGFGGGGIVPEKTISLWQFDRIQLEHVKKRRGGDSNVTHCTQKIPNPLHTLQSTNNQIPTVTIFQFNLRV